MASSFSGSFLQDSMKLESDLIELQSRTKLMVHNYTNKASAFEDAEKYLTEGNKVLTALSDHILEAKQSQVQLEELLTEVKSESDKVEEAILDLYKTFGIEIPEISDTDLPISNFNLNNTSSSIILANNTSEIQQDSATNTPSQLDTSTEGEFEPEIFMQRTLGCVDGENPITPLVSGRRKIFFN